jgi:hypothetical protein
VIDNILRSFSSRFDLAVKYFSDSRLHIYSLDKPEGLFEHSIEQLDLAILSAEVKADTTFRQFVDQCFLIFWDNVEASLTSVRRAIESELKSALNQIIADLVVGLEQIKDNAMFVDDLISSVLTAQTRLQQSLEGLKEWFHTPKPVSPRIFTMDQIVDISLQQVKRLHPDFDPVISKDIVLDFAIIQLTRFADVFFLIFENIQRHAGVGTSPTVAIRIRREARLEIEVLSEMLETEGVEEKLQRLRNVIIAGQYQTIVKSEGGTGLVKLWNLIRLDEAQLEFGVSDSRFRVFISSPVSIFKDALEAIDENIAG